MRGYAWMPDSFEERSPDGGGSTRSAGTERCTCSLTTGKAADLTVLDADPFRADTHEIHALPLVLTMLDGRITHDSR